VSDDRASYVLVGRQVALGVVRRDLLPALNRWVNDWATSRDTGGTPMPYPMEISERWLAGQAADSNLHEFVIFEIAGDRPVGLTRIDQIDPRRGTGLFHILIGEPADRGRGLGSEATRLMLRYGFSILGLRNIMLTVFAFNQAGIRAYEKAGFRELGRRREFYPMGGRRWDLVYMDCLASDIHARSREPPASSPTAGKSWARARRHSTS